MIVKIVLWVSFFIFGISVFWVEQNHASIGITGAFGVGRSAVWLAFFSFLCYTIYCSWRENLIHSLQKMFRMHWARQICIDLYLGLGISIFFIYLNEGSFWLTLFWLIPAIFYANLVVLFYFALHYEMIVARFISI